MSVAVIGAGAFGTALAVALAARGPVTLWARDAGRLAETRESLRLPGVRLPENVSVSAKIGPFAPDTPVLLAIPMQALSGFLAQYAPALHGCAPVACCKGIDLATGHGPTALIAETCPGARPAILTGPGFAADIARGLPTALTLACADAARGGILQERLHTRTLRLYRSTDPVGAELGGALKNVVAIAAGIVIGAGLGDSARAALMTRGYAEMVRLALRLGARAETLAGLSGFGDLVLTCTSEQSRNFRYGRALAKGADLGPGVTVEGAATARAVMALASRNGVDMPVTGMVAAVIEGRHTVGEAVQALLSRPLKQE